jgi:hypothetical protein
MDVKAVLVGPSSRRAERERAMAEAERGLLLRRHEENQKHNARLKAQGVGGRFTCPPQCPQCYPAAPQGAGNDIGLSTLDLRGKVARPKMKRGTCAGCGERIRGNRRAFYHPACKGQPARVIPPRRCAFCPKVLPEGCNPRRAYCGDPCQQRARRARRATGS